MATSVWIVGRSGSGKSTSLLPLEEELYGEPLKIEGLSPSTTVVLNCDDKPLPGDVTELYTKGENYYEGVDADQLLSLLQEVNKNPKVKAVVLDTWSRWASNIVDNPAFDQGDGRKAWKKFANTQIILFNAINKLMRPDIIVYIMAHPEEYTNEYGELDLRIASQGQMLNVRGGVESFSTIVLYTQKVKRPGKPDAFTFRTGNFATAKSPIGMFDSYNIPNDLGLVDRTIRSKLKI